MSETRLHPDLVPGQNKNFTWIQTPGPAAYTWGEHDREALRKLKQSSSFKAPERSSQAITHSIQENFPGPGQYNLPVKKESIQGKSTHFEMSTARDTKAHSMEIIDIRQKGKEIKEADISLIAPANVIIR